MAELKTKPTRKSAAKFLASIERERRRIDAQHLLTLFGQTTGWKPVMWGDSIVGYGRYHYRQRSGQQAIWPITGFSPRKQNLVVYIMPGFDDYQALLARLGKHRTARSCLYINKLADVDTDVLAELVAASVRDMQERYCCE